MYNDEMYNNETPNITKQSSSNHPGVAPLVAALAIAFAAASCGGGGSGGGAVGGGGNPSGGGRSVVVVDVFDPVSDAPAPTNPDTTDPANPDTTDPANPDTTDPTDPVDPAEPEPVAPVERGIQPIAPAFDTTDASRGVLPDAIVPEQYNRRALPHVSAQNENDLELNRLDRVRVTFFDAIDKTNIPTQTHLTIVAPYATPAEVSAAATPSDVCTQADYRPDPADFNPEACDAVNANAHSGYWYERVVATTIGRLRYDPGGGWGDVPSLQDDTETTDVNEAEDDATENRGYITLQRCNTPSSGNAVAQISASYNCLTGNADGLQTPDVLFYQQGFERSPHTEIEHTFAYTNNDGNDVTFKFNPQTPDGDFNNDGNTDPGYLPSQEVAADIAESFLGYPDLTEYFRDSAINHLFSPRAAGLDPTEYDPLIVIPAVAKPPEITVVNPGEPGFAAYEAAVNARQAVIDGLENVFFPAAVKAENVLFVAPVDAVFIGSAQEFAATPGAATCGDFRLRSVLDICLAANGIYFVDPDNDALAFSPHEGTDPSTGYNSAFSTENGDGGAENNAVAAAYVSGIASIVRAQWPSLTATQTRDLLLACAERNAIESVIPSDPVVVGRGVLSSVECLTEPSNGVSGLPCADTNVQRIIDNGACIRTSPTTATRRPVTNPLDPVTSASGGVLSPDSFNSDAFVFYDYFNRDFKRDVVTSSNAPAHLAPLSHPLSLVRHNTSNNAFSDDSAFAPTISHTFSSKACSLAVGVALESASFAGASGYGDFELGTSYTPHLAAACSFNLRNDSSVSLFASHTRSVMPSAAQQSIVSRIEGSQSVLGARITSQKGPLLLSLEARHGSGVKGSLHAFGETLAVNPKPWTHASLSLSLPF